MHFPTKNKANVCVRVRISTHMSMHTQNIKLTYFSIFFSFFSSPFLSFYLNPFFKGYQNNKWNASTD